MALNMKHHSKLKNPTNVELKLPQHMEPIGDSQLNNIELVNDFDISDNDGRSLRIKHKKIRFVRRRLKRETTENNEEFEVLDSLHKPFNEGDSMDPIKMHENSLDLKSLYAKVRNKRTKQAINKLEKEYKRCKKESDNNQDCMVIFMRMYNLAREINEKMEKMRAIFKDSETLLQANSTSSSPESMEHSTEAVNRGLTKTITARTSTTASNERSTNKMSGKIEKIKPSKISWILDGHEYSKSHEEFAIIPDTRINNATTTVATTTAETIKANAISPTITTTEIIDSIEHLSLENVIAEEFTPTTYSSSDSSENFITSRNVAIKTITSPMTTPATSAKTIPSTTAKLKVTSTIENPIQNQIHMQRKLQFDGKLLNDDELIAEMTEASSSIATTTEMSFKTTATHSSTTLSPTDSDANSVETYSSTTKSLTVAAIIGKVTVESDKCENNSLEVNSCKLDVMENKSIVSLNEDDETLHDPNSLEDILESLERIPVDIEKINKTFDSVDRKDWEKLFQEAILKNQQEILESFGEFDAKNMTKFEPKLNPVNSNNFEGK